MTQNFKLSWVLSNEYISKLMLIFGSALLALSLVFLHWTVSFIFLWNFKCCPEFQSGVWQEILSDFFPIILLFRADSLQDLIPFMILADEYLFPNILIHQLHVLPFLFCPSSEKGANAQRCLGFHILLCLMRLAVLLYFTASSWSDRVHVTLTSRIRKLSHFECMSAVLPDLWGNTEENINMPAVSDVCHDLLSLI